MIFLSFLRFKENRLVKRPLCLAEKVRLQKIDTILIKSMTVAIN